MKEWALISFQAHRIFVKKVLYKHSWHSERVLD